MLNLPVGQKRLTNVAQVKYKVGKSNFTLACYRNKVIAWRLGQEHDINEVLQIDAIFTNVNRGEVANDSELNKAFKSTIKEERIKMILDHGILQVTDEERDSLNNETFKKVAQFVSDRVLEATTGTRMSLEGIEEELRNLGFSVQWTIDPKRQGLKAIQLLEAPREGSAYVVRSWFKVQLMMNAPVREVMENGGHAFATRLHDIVSKGNAFIVPYDNTSHTLTVMLHPSEYGAVSNSASKELPEAKLTIASTDINPLDYQKKNVASRPPASTVVTNPFTTAPIDLFSATAVPLFPLDGEGAISEPDAADVITKSCHICSKVDQKGTFTGDTAAQLYRKHMRCEWHNFNVQRMNAGAEAIDMELYEAMLEQLEDESDSD